MAFSWSAVFDGRHGADPQIDDWSSANIDRMNSGRAPQRYNPDKGGIESMELGHEPIPFRDGGRDFFPRWPQDHAAVDPFRRPAYQESTMLAEQFEKAQSDVIEWEGLTVRSMVRLTPVSERLTVHFDRWTSDPVQGIRLKVRGGRLSVNGEESTDLVLWTDTAPPEVTVSVTGASEVRLWNVWRGGQGVIQAWLGNAGMLVDDPQAQRITLRCSDGHGDADFDDLVLSVDH